MYHKSASDILLIDQNFPWMNGNNTLATIDLGLYEAISKQDLI